MRNKLLSITARNNSLQPTLPQPKGSVRHRPSRQVQVQPLLRGNPADVVQDAELRGGKAALHQEVVVAHDVRFSALCRQHWRTRPATGELKPRRLTPFSISSPRMVSQIDLLQPFFQYVRVDWGRREVAMAQNELDGPGGGSALEQMSGKRMTEHVGRQSRGDAGTTPVAAEQLPESHAG